MTETNAAGESRSTPTDGPTGETGTHAGEAVRLIAQLWGLGLTARRLSGEKDVNFRLSDAAGGKRLLKIYSADTDPAVVAMQAAALRHVETHDPDLPVQRVVLTPRGESVPVVRLEDGFDHPVRMVSFLDGASLDESDASPAQRRAVGAMSARLQTALVDFSHPNDDHLLVWDMKRAATLRPHLAFFEGAERDRLEQILDGFEAEILPVMPYLPTQVVHNDFNGDNLLVDPNDPTRIVGVIDFDDTVRAPRLFDLAVACSYQIRDAEDPIAAIRDCLDGYTTLIRPTAREARLLPAAILTRMAMRLIIPEWRSEQIPHNRAYVTRNSPLVRSQFARFDRLSEAEIEDRLVAPLIAR